jgi:sigma-B regulation protein RsbU (phosphoserine phosphatase)
MLHAARIAAAVAFAACTLFYSATWMLASRWANPHVELGYDAVYVAETRVQLVREVYAGSAAEAAGMRVGDRIVAIDAQPFTDSDFQRRKWFQHQAGEKIQLSIERTGAPAPITLTATFRDLDRATALGDFFGDVRDLYPVPFVLVGLTVLLLRVSDRNAWLLALLLASFTTIAAIPDPLAINHPVLFACALGYKAVLLGLIGPLFYFFFAVFPVRSPLDLRLPWLKWAAIAVNLTFIIGRFRTGLMRIPAPLDRFIRPQLVTTIPFWLTYAFLMLGLVSLVLNFVRSRDAEARRKIRVLLWGTLVGLGPGIAQGGARHAFGYQAPPWLDTADTLISILFPLSFAYAVVKHRVLEVPVLLKRSARYLLVQRGFTIVLSLLSIALTLLFAMSFAGRLEAASGPVGPSGIALGAAFGTALLWSGAWLHRQVSERIDRAFFRQAYDARVILEDLAERLRSVTQRRDVADLLAQQLRQALQPSSLWVYLRSMDGQLVAADSSRQDGGLQTIPADLPEIARLKEPWEVPPQGLPALAELHPNCLAPMLGYGGKMLGLLVLGERLSEVPYSGEDRRLLAVVASQAAAALDNIGLAEQIAERLEVERRSAREMEIAREVQTRLLPQTTPPLRTLDYAAECIQTRSVGGDYYDFLDTDGGPVALVLADVSGKGVYAALLMANLQAQLRSRIGIAPLDPAKLLRGVNRMLWKSTLGQHYATLFFGIYDDAARRLTYVNCGHNPPFWIRADGTVQRLAA